MQAPPSRLKARIPPLRGAAQRRSRKRGGIMQALPGRELLTAASGMERLEPLAMRPRAFLAEAFALVGLVLVKVAFVEHPLRVVLRGQDMRRDPIEEPAVVRDHERAAGEFR